MFQAVLGTANLHSIPQPQFRKIAMGGPQRQIRKFAAHFRKFFALPQPQMTFYFRKLLNRKLCCYFFLVDK